MIRSNANHHRPRVLQRRWRAPRRSAGLAGGNRGSATALDGTARQPEGGSRPHRQVPQVHRTGTGGPVQQAPGARLDAGLCARVEAAAGHDPDQPRCARAHAATALAGDRTGSGRVTGAELQPRAACFAVEQPAGCPLRHRAHRHGRSAAALLDRAGAGPARGVRHAASRGTGPRHGLRAAAGVADIGDDSAALLLPAQSPSIASRGVVRSAWTRPFRPVW